MKNGERETSCFLVCSPNGCRASRTEIRNANSIQVPQVRDSNPTAPTSPLSPVVDFSKWLESGTSQGSNSGSLMWDEGDFTSVLTACVFILTYLFVLMNHDFQAAAAFCCCLYIFFRKISIQDPFNFQVGLSFYY